ncbi:MAG: APC family permease [Gammaproteobacteria bacterium]
MNTGTYPPAGPPSPGSTRSGKPARRALGAWTGTLLIVASMIGTGVFTTTGLLLAEIHSVQAVLVCWVVGGLLALTGALSYAELAAALPENGGEFLFLSRIFHPAVGFVAGVVSLIVGFSAPIAASAIALSFYLERAFPGAPTAAVSGTLIIGLSLLHAWHVRVGGGFQVAVTSAKVLLIIALIVAGLWRGDAANLLASPAAGFTDELLSPSFAIGLVLVSFAYTGWNASVYIAGELERPRRNIPLSLAAGTLIVTMLYVGLNVVFVTAVPVGQLAGVVEIGHVAAAGLFGGTGARVLSAIISLGLVSTISAYIMSGPRVYEAMGETYPRLGFLAGRGRHANRGPVAAIALQAVIALAMLLTASFEALLTYIGFTLSLFAALTVIGVIVLRVREPELERPYRVAGYPLTPLLFVALMLWMIWNAIALEPVVALAGLVTLACAGALYGWLGRRD